MHRLTRGEEKVVLALEKEERKSYYEIAKVTGLSEPGARKIVNKLVDLGIIIHDPNNPYKRYSLNRERVLIKRNYYVKMSSKTSSYTILKELILPSFLGLCIAFLLAFLYKEFALIFALGGLTTFLPQFFYSFYKILHSEEEVEVYVTG